MPLTVPTQEVDGAVPLSRCGRNKHSPAIATLDARLASISSPFHPVSSLPETFSRSLFGSEGRTDPGLQRNRSRHGRYLTLVSPHVFARLVPFFPNRNVLALLCSRKQTPMGLRFHSAQIATNHPSPPFGTFAFDTASPPAPRVP